MSRALVTWPVFKITVAFLVALMVVLVAVWMRPWQADPVRTSHIDEAQGGGLVDPTVANPGYVGPMACADCHASRVAEFQETRHFLANRVPTGDIMPEGFRPGRGHFRVPELALQFEMAEANGHFHETAVRQSSVPPQSVSSEIAFIYGAAGGGDEVYFSWRDGKLNELPMVWLAPLKSWGASPFDRHGSGDFSREMTIRCVECHNTWFEHAPGSRNQYGHDNFILGVTCEVCHGPGREHVAFHRDHPLSREAHAVTRPSELSRERLMDLCAQCHSNALKHRGPAFSYRPGQPLDDSYFTIQTKHPEDDHVANQTTYLRQSRCFQESETLTCVTCHNPHRPRSTVNAGSESCRTCHQHEDCRDRDRLPVAVQDDCIACHMPEHRKIQVYFQTEADKYVAPVKRFEHKIGIYPLARKSVLLDWYRTQSDAESREIAAGLARELGESWKSQSQVRRDEYRYLAAIDACRESLRFHQDPVVEQELQDLIKLKSTIDSDLQDAQWHESERRYPQAIEAFQKVLAAKPDHALAHGKLGTTYAVVGEKLLAIKHLQAASEFDPHEPYAPAMLGWLAYLDGRADEALEHFLRADAVEPYSAKINYQIGLACSKLDRWPDAVKRFTKSVTIDPKSANGYLVLGQALSRTGQANEALKHVLKAARLTEFHDPQILANLADAYAATDQLDAAIQTLQQALVAAEGRQPKLVSQIRSHLDELRSRRQKRP